MNEFDQKLPVLLTDCVLVGHARKADLVFTPPQFFAVCTHMMNENPANFFLMPYRDKDGKPKFAKAYQANAQNRMQWTWDTITGKAKAPASIGFYPTNSQRQTQWGAMDFDSHDDQHMRARSFAHKAFTVLCYKQPQLFLALTTSAGDPIHSGWHLFAFSKDFIPCEEWTRLFKQVADEIGAPVQNGVCEIFPAECRGIPKGIRAPGTWNPKTGTCGLIVYENLSSLFPECGILPLPASSPKEVLCSLGARSTVPGSLPNREFFRISAPHTRHVKLLQLVGALFFQCARENARKFAELQYTQANPTPVASLDEHLAEFDSAWTGMERAWKGKLLTRERELFDNLTTDTEREAFRIIRNWMRTDSPDSYIHCQTLGERLGITLQGAANLRRRFCVLGILKQTASYVPHKLAARYQWRTSKKPARTKGAFNPSSNRRGPRRCAPYHLN